MFSTRLGSVAVAVVVAAGCGGLELTGLEGGSGGGGAAVGGSGAGSGGAAGSAGQFSCADIRKTYELTGTNTIQGVCEAGSRITYKVTASGCAVQFQATVSGQSISGSCTVSAAGDCDTTVQLGGSAYEAKLHFDAGAAKGTASLGRGGSTCFFTAAAVSLLGRSCSCPGMGTGVSVCSTSPDCDTGQACVQEDARDGAYCSHQASQCTGAEFEKRTVNGIALCGFKKKLGSCMHSAQCDGCSSGTAGVTVAAGCFSGTCRMRCTSTSPCSCTTASPTGGNATGYCSSLACQ